MLLYELLTGSTPLERDALRRGGVSPRSCGGSARRSRPSPSTRLSRLGRAAAVDRGAAAHEPAQLTRLVRGELDWIVMKALEKDRTRRYETASGFAGDIERYLDGEPVEACPPSAALPAAEVRPQAPRRRWRRRRPSRRFCWPATAVSDYLAPSCRSAEGLAKSRLAEAEQSRERGEGGEPVHGRVLRQARSGRGRCDSKVVDLLDAAVVRLDSQSAGSPAIRGALLNALGETYGGLGIADRAVAVSTRAYDTLKASLGPDHPETLRSRNTLANAYRSAGRTADAIALAEETLRLQTAGLGPTTPTRSGSRDPRPRLLGGRARPSRSPCTRGRSSLR